MNNKKFKKRGPQPATLLFLYEVSIVVLIDFIAILQTPGIFLIPIANTNMYIIHVLVKIIFKNVFRKVGFLSFKTTTDIHYPMQRDEINSIISKDFTCRMKMLKKKILRIYFVKKFEFF